MRLESLAFLTVALCGCAPTQPTTRPASPLPPTFAPAVYESSRNSMDRQALTDGYRKLMRKGEPVYCKSVAELGTRIPKSVCLTPDQYQQVAERAASDRQDLRQNTTRCGSIGDLGGTCGTRDPIRDSH